ncbi:hypothetical protein N0V93_002443 [Gnomoniopsis smithogilvyi]|uniref:LysM domain-containing protein n=1 Tax=Gnomoniopsis smithogilvyi TaxID=1191159 RepID=A0A9W9CXN7_9PEZI|nr:hypothetical protein N0V93_002443 [Gnomoniopsis smithogilvyi]
MQFAILALASLASLATATPSRAIMKRCETKEIQFHFNNTDVGSVQSCSTDVMDRGSTAPGTAAKHIMITRTDNTTCVDGPDVTYTVVSGDTLEKIAAEFSSGVCNIAEASGLTNPDFLALDQKLTVPTNVCAANIDNDTCRTSAGTATCVTGGEPTYKIKAGDTFFLIAAELGITLDSLVAENPGVDPGSLQVDQEIDVPVC